VIAACQFKAFFQNVFNLFHVNVILLPYVLQHKNTAFSWNLYFKTRKKAITLSLFDLNQFIKAGKVNDKNRQLHYSSFW